MAEQLIKYLVEALIENFPKEKAKEIIDGVLDKLEEKVEASENKFDDAIVLPLIKELIRKPFGIEDND